MGLPSGMTATADRPGEAFALAGQEPGRQKPG